jgi:hypothetical protein
MRCANSVPASRFFDNFAAVSEGFEPGTFGAQVVGVARGRVAFGVVGFEFGDQMGTVRDKAVCGVDVAHFGGLG